MTSRGPRLPIWDGAPDELLEVETDRALAAGCAVTVNPHRSGMG